MRVGRGPATYEWVGDWTELDDGHHGWAHPGTVVTDAGEVMTFHPDESRVLVYDLDGSFKRDFRVALEEGHGMTLVGRADAQRLWIADPGWKIRRQPDGTYADVYTPPHVCRFTLDGTEEMSLETPPLDIYADGGYRPTDVAVDEGGSGDIWVADGYGRNHVHRFDAEGNYISSINGEEGGGSFSIPHSVFVDRRRPDPELYVADRGNARLQVYALDGTFKRVVGADFLNSVGPMITYNGSMVVAELFARLAVLDIDDRLITYVGSDQDALGREGWPNEGAERVLVRPAGLSEGRFNSPHGLGVDADGNLYVAEWIIGGRYTKLVKVPD